jgi:hypothetical protein
MKDKGDIQGPDGLASRPRQNWPTRATRLLDGDVIFVNPHDFTEYAFGSIDLLALLWDRVIIDSPRQGLFAETSTQSTSRTHVTTYPLNRFLTMVEHGIFIPYDWIAAIDDKRAGNAGAFWKRGKFQRIIDSDNYIIREDVTRSTKFYNYFNPKIDRDMDDPKFEEVIKTNLQNMPLNNSNLNLTPGTLNEIKHRFALHVNWDGGLAQILGADIFIHSSTQPIWKYKVQNLATNIGFNGIEMELQSFIDRLRMDFPSRISIHEIEDFRNASEAKNFKRWLRCAIQAAKEQNSPVPLEEKVYLEFIRLCEAHQRRNEKVSGYISGLFSALISGSVGLAINGPAGAIIGGGIGLGIGEGLKHPIAASTRLLKKKIGGDWTFFFAERIPR